MALILAIESSCDETAASVCRDGAILSNVIADQKVHEQYGGVVPELASRAHMQNIVPVVDAAMAAASCGPRELDALAFTQAPGLIGSLLVGAQFARSMAVALNKPLIAVHHMQAHVIANLIPQRRPPFPFLCLTVSGGHTQIVRAESPTNMEVIGQTVDDAAGEAFDKAAKMLKLPYPGGPLIDRYAQGGNSHRFRFAEPQVEGLDFSFSGFKTSVLYFLQKELTTNLAFIEENRADICASVQHTIVQVLLKKLTKASAQTGIRDICLAGGVSANSALRNQFEELGRKKGWNTFIPPFEYCTDNAAMIALTAYYKYQAGHFAALSESASARSEWPLS